MILALAPLLLVLAETAPASGTDLVINPWAQLGATGGLIALLIVAIRVLYKSQADTSARERARADAAEADNDRLYRELVDRLVPTILDAQRATLDAVTELRVARDEMRTLRERR